MLAKRFCPRCGSEDVTLAAAGIGGMWMCKACGYTGSFPEKSMVGRKDESTKKGVKK